MPRRYRSGRRMPINRETLSEPAQQVRHLETSQISQPVKELVQIDAERLSDLLQSPNANLFMSVLQL